MELFLSLMICVTSLGVVFCLYRLLTGPTLAERTVAGDGLLSMVMGIFILLSVLQRTDLYLNAVLVIALLGFITTLAVARYLEMTDDL